MPRGTTATDLVLTITEILRKHGAVGKFVEENVNVAAQYTDWLKPGVTGSHRFTP